MARSPEEKLCGSQRTFFRLGGTTRVGCLPFASKIVVFLICSTFEMQTIWGQFHIFHNCGVSGVIQPSKCLLSLIGPTLKIVKQSASEKIPGDLKPRLRWNARV